MTEALPSRYKCHSFPAEIIAHAVWLYYRFPLSFRDVEDMLAERGIKSSFQTVSEWVAKSDMKFAYQLRRVRASQKLDTDFAKSWTSTSLMSGQFDEVGPMQSGCHQG